MRMMDERLSGMSRRAFLARGATVFAAMHAPYLNGSAVAQTSSDFRFKRIELESQVPDELAAFYRDVLELPVRSDEGTCEITAGESALVFHRAKADTQPFYHFAFNIPENKLEQAMEWAKPKFSLLYHRKSGGPVVHFKLWNAHAVYFLDPAGNIVEFIARHTLDNTASGAFSSADILNVSEIGFVTPDVPDLQQQILDNLGIGVYKSAAPVFAPLGHEHALFILAKEGRVWLPTDDVKGVPHPAKVLAAGIDGALDVKGQPFSVEPV